MASLESKVFWFVHPRTKDLQRLQSMVKYYNSLVEPSFLVVLTWGRSEEKVFDYLHSYQGRKPLLYTYDNDGKNTEEQMEAAQTAAKASSSIDFSDAYHFLGGVNGHNCVSALAEVLLTGRTYARGGNDDFLSRPRAKKGRVFAVDEFLRQSFSHRKDRLFENWASPVEIPIITKRDITNPYEKKYPRIVFFQLAFAHAYTNFRSQF